MAKGPGVEPRQIGCCGNLEGSEKCMVDSLWRWAGNWDLHLLKEKAGMRCLSRSINVY